MATSIIESLVQAMQRRMAHQPKRIRPYTKEYATLPKALILTGARGCGKSTFLLHHALGKRILYFSADNPRLINVRLYDIVSNIFAHGYEGVIIDEVHYATNCSIHLKALYDDYPDNIIWTSDSSSLVLSTGEGDLSRRFVPIHLPLMSFREYLYLETGKEYPKYTLGDTQLPATPDAELLNHFSAYRCHGSRPFYQDGDFESRYLAIINKTLNNDVPFFLPSITDNNIRAMRAIIGSLAYSSIPRIQVTSLCADWGIGAEKLYQLLFVMESVELIKIIRLQNDTKARSIGAKMLFSDPCAYHVMNANEGTEREAYIVNCFVQAGYNVEAMRDEKRGDYVVTLNNTQTTIEVGGKHKKSKASDIVLRDNTDYPALNAIPFWLIGMMW